MGLVPWSPLAGGFLTGKYKQADVGAAGQRGPELPSGAAAKGDQPSEQGRLAGANPFGDSKFTNRNWAILDALLAVAEEAGASPAAVALAWVVGCSGVASTLIGASRPEQIADNVASLAVELSSEQRKRLDQASEPAPVAPFSLFSPFIRQMVFGGHQVETRSP